MNRRGIPRPPADEQAAASVDAGRCSAPGCKLPGVLNEATGGGGDWFCRCHFGAAYGEMADITLRVNNRMHLYRQALRWSNESPAEPVSTEAAVFLRQVGRDSLLQVKPAIDGKPLTMRTLARHLLAALDAECRGSEEARQQNHNEQSDEVYA